MSGLITATKLWKRAFGQGCPHSSELEQSLLQARESTRELLAGIPGDMKGYTVHDMSHLDALWEMADLIAGDSFELNPVEAYVFGVSVLLHDAGMTVMAYPRGLQDLIETDVWKEAIKCRGASRADASDLQAQSRAALITDVLRRLHAERAEHLATQAWTLGAAQYHLIQSDQLREHYGPLAGKVAHSHHWDAGSLSGRLPAALGALGEMPADWIVHPLKVATLLRCADAAHIDHRRAPRLTFAMSKPEGVSQVHWNFQSKLAKPYLKDRRLCYTSREAFKSSEVDAWYLCYDTARMVDRELVDAEENLRPLGQRFAVDGVCGTRSVGAYSEYVAAEGWRPVPIDVQVSDVPSLARTLGGSALYSSRFAPLRELIQNAADSIEARCAVDQAFSRDAGTITVRLREYGGDWRLDVEDNGIGMSERVLTRALLDFGKSFWRSDLIQEEYPEMQGGFVSARGRYGIGFFSVFMWADRVQVASRRFSDAMADTAVLEFTGGVGKRPILRSAEPRERSSSVSTRVSLYVDAATAEMLLAPHDSTEPDVARRSRLGRHEPLLCQPLELLVAALEIDVHFETPVGSRCVNQKHWRRLDGPSFVRYFSAFCGGLGDVDAAGAQLSEVIESGEVVGRALLVPPFLGTKMPTVLVHERGITVQRRYEGEVFGVLEAAATNAARDRTTAGSIVENREWINEQRGLIFTSAPDPSRAVAAQRLLVKRGTFSPEHELFILNRKICSFNHALDEIARLGQVIIQVKADASAGVEWDSEDSLGPILSLTVKPSHLFVLCKVSIGQGGHDFVESVIRGDTNSGLFSEIMADIRRVLGAPLEINVRVVERESYSRRVDYYCTLKRG